MPAGALQRPRTGVKWPPSARRQTRWPAAAAPSREGVKWPRADLGCYRAAINAVGRGAGWRESLTLTLSLTLALTLTVTLTLTLTLTLRSERGMCGWTM